MRGSKKYANVPSFFCYLRESGLQCVTVGVAKLHTKFELECPQQRGEID